MNQLWATGTQGMSPIAVLLINKKMPYEEEIQRTILYFDQVRTNSDSSG